MKILVIGDCHLRALLPYSGSIDDGRKSEWEDVLSKIYEVAKTCDMVVQAGDIVHMKNNPSVVVDDLVKFLNGFGDKQIFVLRGNHDLLGGRSAIDFIKSFNRDNWHVFTEITNDVKIGDITASFVPYLTPQMVGAKDKESGVNLAIEKLKPADIAFFHIPV